jgi:3-dehydroquinate synthase class II
MKLAPADKVPGCIEQGGRHFGFKIEETINEK